MRYCALLEMILRAHLRLRYSLFFTWWMFTLSCVGLC